MGDVEVGVTKRGGLGLELKKGNLEIGLDIKPGEVEYGWEYKFRF